MKFIFALIVSFMIFPTSLSAQDQEASDGTAPLSEQTPSITQTYLRAEITKIFPGAVETSPNEEAVELEFVVQGGERNGELIRSNWAFSKNSQERDLKLREGSQVILSCSVFNERELCTVAGIQRTKPLVVLAALFVALVWYLARRQGLVAVGTIILSLAIIIFVTAPLIVRGFPALPAAILSGLVIIIPTIYFSHGFRLSSHIAIGSILVVSILVTALSFIFMGTLQLTGMGAEESLYLNLGIDLRAVLLSAILLGALGVIDDLAITQTSIVTELAHLHPAQHATELYQRAMRVGRSHIVAVINTLFLAYVGVALPLVILIVQNEVPAFIALQYEAVVTEIMRILIGTIGLMVVVPLATYFSALLITRYPEKFPLPKDLH